MHASFGGVTCIERASFTMRHGVTPSTGSVTFPISASPPLSGAFVLSDGTYNITITPCYLVDPVIVEHETGFVIEATVADRRILWKYGYVNGKWNSPDDTGIPKKERSLETLLNDCLQTNYGVTINFFSMPMDGADYVYPSVEWNFENPAAAAQELCERYNLAISLDVDGSVWIGPSAFDRTADLPTATPMSRETSTVDPFKPTDIYIVGSRKVNQEDFLLYPIGIEKTTNELKPINQLSYTPASGWGVSAVNDFNDITDETSKKLAKKCIFRWYGWFPPAVGDRKKKLPWLAHISETTQVLEDSTNQYSTQRSLPRVFCIRAKTDDDITFSHTAEVEYEGDFTIDNDRGVVKFSERVFKIKNYSAPVQALTEIEGTVVKLKAAYELNTGADTDFLTHITPVSGGTLRPYIVNCKELTLYMVNGTPTSQDVTDLTAYCTSVASKVLALWSHIAPKQKVYPALAQLNVYGDVKSITWNVDSGAGATSIVSVGVEEITPFIPTYTERALQKKSAALHWPSSKRVEETNNRRKHGK